MYWILLITDQNLQSSTAKLVSKFMFRLLFRKHTNIKDLNESKINQTELHGGRGGASQSSGLDE